MKHESLRTIRPENRMQARLMALNKDFETILFGQASPEWAPQEQEILPEMAIAFPDANEKMLMAIARILCGFTASAPALVALSVPAHTQIMQSYAWGSSDRHPGQAEGAGPFWLYEASNEVLARAEIEIAPSFTQFFHPNHFRPLVVRAWLRMQAVYFNPDEAGRLIGIWNDSALSGGEPFDVLARAFVAAP